VWILKRLFQKPKTEAKPQKPAETAKTVTYNDLSVFDLPEGQGRWCLVLGAEGQGKTYMVRLLAQRFERFAYVEATEFQPVKDVDLYIIDDLHKAPKQKHQEIFMWLCGARHDRVSNVVVVTQELKGIPSEIIRRFKVLALFYSAKQHMKLQTVIRGGLREASEFANRIIDLLPRQYILYDVQTGATYNSLQNTDIDRLLKAMEKPLPKPKNRQFKVKKSVIKLPNGDIFDRRNIKLTPLVIKTIKEHPEYKYRYIAEIFGITENHVKNIAFRARKRGLLP